MSYSTQYTTPHGAGYNQPNFRWFVPGEGISRSVIQSEIQRYLGSEALVRTGMGKDEYEGIPGYWISAYRNLTPAMVDDLKRLSARQEPEMDAGGRGHYGDSPVYDSRAAPPPATVPYGQTYPSHAQNTQSYATHQSASGYPVAAADPYSTYPPSAQAQQPLYGTSSQLSHSNLSQYGGSQHVSSLPSTAQQLQPSQQYPYPSPPPSTQYTSYPVQSGNSRPAAAAAAYPAGYTTQAQVQPNFYPTSQTQRYIGGSQKSKLRANF